MTQATITRPSEAKAIATANHRAITAPIMSSSVSSPAPSASSQGERRHAAGVRSNLIAALAALLALAGCGGEGDTAERPAALPAGERAAPRSFGEREGEKVVPSRCPAGLPSCRVTEGRIVFVERVDPDGDGDAHFVVADPQGISLPGLTAIDVRSGLRPRPLPGIGDLISAAGPVQTGSYGQSQIHALELHVAR